MKMMWPQVDLSSGNVYYKLVFSDKKKSNSKNFSDVGFCAPEMSTKFWDFAVGMDFDTSYILNEMSQMHDFCPSNSVPTIFYGNNHFAIYLIATKP